MPTRRNKQTNKKARYQQNAQSTLVDIIAIGVVVIVAKATERNKEKYTGSKQIFFS